MLKILSILFTLVMTSFYLFPFFPTFMPSVNTKMVLAACGLLLVSFRLAINGKARIDRGFFILSVFALCVSFVSLISITLNDTSDSSYLFYIVSMWVWLGGAYFVTNLVKFTHGKVNVELVCYYLISVGVLQCVLAVMVDSIPAVKTFIDSILSGEGFMGKNEGRLYGLGCALDVAGGRFAVLLTMIAFLLPRVVLRHRSNWHVILLLLAFGILSVIGNIIGRTTTIGLVLSLLYLSYVLVHKRMPENAKKRLGGLIIGCILSFSCIATYLYQTNASWHHNLSFGFEGFFSLVEHGRWEVHSNEMLKSHYVYPDNFHTWVIGDGYFGSTDVDPYYTGFEWKGFYKGTDVGYCRFLFYFGLFGLVLFSSFIVEAGLLCINKFQSYRYLFGGILLVNFIIWAKVSTDIFLILALFLCIPKEENDAYEQQCLLTA